MMKTESQYRHGGSPKIDQDRLNLADRPILDFSVNLNSLGVPAIIRHKWTEFLETIESYPSVEGDGVVYYYQKKFDIPSENILAGNGSTEMIYLVPRVLRFNSVVIVTPSYHDYERASMLAGAKVMRHPLSPENRFSFPGVRKLIETLKNSEALWLGRPNNPTGTLFPKEFILELADIFPDKWFIIDESFIQFTELWEENSLLVGHPKSNILVIHSLTKFYSIAGLRLGGVVGSKETISRLKNSKEPWSVNGIADKIAPLLLECADYEHQTRYAVARERERIFKRLEELDGITPFLSSANFVLCQWTKTNNLDDIVYHLLSNGVYIRDCRNFPGLEKNFFRVALRAMKDNDRLISLLSSF